MAGTAVQGDTALNEVPEPESALPRIPGLIAGTWAPGGAEGDVVYDPALGIRIAELPYASDADVDAAVAAAGAAQPAWAARPLEARLAVLGELRRLIAGEEDALAATIVRESGKTLGEAHDEVEDALRLLDQVAGAAGAVLTERETPDGWRVSREPLGIAAGISLYHFPLLSPLWMIAPAIASGDAFVLRPCTWAPSAAVRLAELFERAGLPAGVLDVVQGSLRVVDRLLDHPGVAAVSYVGSGTWPHHMYRRGAAAQKRVQALGAVRHIVVVTESGDPDLAVQLVTRSAYGMAGVRWLAGTVLVVVGKSGTADGLVERVVDAACRIRVGPGSDPGVEMGPVPRPERLVDLHELIDTAVAEGSTLRLDGRRPVAAEPAGFFLGPTIFEGVGRDSVLWTRELLGPILLVVEATDLDGALAWIADSPHGNVATIVTEDDAEAKRFEREAAAGVVAVDRPVTPSFAAPLAVRRPGFDGDLAYWGEESLRFHTRPRVVSGRRSRPSDTSDRAATAGRAATSV